MNNVFKGLLDELKKEHSNKNNLTLNSKVLIIDGINTYLRAFQSSPLTNDDGIHIGGMIGFLKSISFAIKNLKPTRCIVVFDGKGGSYRRRQLYPQYKSNRRIKYRYNRVVSSDSSYENKMSIFQMNRLMDYLDYLPVNVIVIENVEADDVISYICKSGIKDKDSSFYIMSTDKDFYQLISENIFVWSPTKKKLYNKNSIYEEYGISSENFIYYKVLEGDVSDNISGIKGSGLKTIKKYLPNFTNKENYNLEKLYEDCELGKDKSKLLNNILLNKSSVDLNYRLMQLLDVDISGDAKLRILENLKKINILNKTKILTMYIEDRFSGAIPDISSWIDVGFSVLNSFLLNKKGL